MIGDANAKKYFYHTDHVGSVRAVTDDVGKVVWKSDYLAFGTQFGKDKLDPSFEEDEFAFTGKGFDGDTGLYYYNARWYDSETGRFMSEDPVGQGPNAYSYCMNDPVNMIDPSGLYGYDGQTGQISHPDGTITDTGGHVISTPPGGSNPGYGYSPGGYGSSGGGTPQTTTTYDPKSKTETITDKGTGSKLAETQYDNKGNLKSTKYYNPDGTLQSEYLYNKDYTVSSCITYNPNGTRNRVDFTYTKHGVIVTTKDQSKGLLGWVTKSLSLEGYNDINDLSSGNWNFRMNNDGKVTASGDIVNGNLLAISCGMYLGNISDKQERFNKWLSLVRNDHNWDFKKSLDGKQFMVNGTIVADHVFGNINIAYTAACLGISKTEFKLFAAAYTATHPKGENPFTALVNETGDWQAYGIGYNMFNNLDANTRNSQNPVNLSPYEVFSWGKKYFGY